MEKERNMLIFCLLLAALSSPVFSGEWKASIVENLDTVVGSCVVVQCTFTHPKGNLPTSRLRGIWHRSNKQDEMIYYEDYTQILENFRGRTRLLGRLGQGNCTLEITGIKDHDNGPFCFRVELAKTETDISTTEKFSFVEDCVELIMLSEPLVPSLSHPKTAIQDHPLTITCSVTHACPSHEPQLTWSRGAADEITEIHKPLQFGYWEKQSILTIIPGEKDDHSAVTCTATFNGPRTSSQIMTIFIKSISSPVFSGEWKASVVRNLDTLVGSCVVVPCTFTHPKGNLPTSRLRGIWHRSNKQDERIYYEDSTQVLENFRGRTRLLGHLGQGNCTLEITGIKDHDNGPFCFRVELAKTETDISTTEKFSFVEDCVELIMLPEPLVPSLSHPKTAIQDHPFTITCSVTHTCPSHEPQLTWDRGAAHEITEIHRSVFAGIWEKQSILTIIPGEKDDHSEVTCTAKFNGEDRTSTASMEVFVKRAENYNHIIIPAAVGVGTAVIFAVFCIFMVKKYKNRIAELQSREGSVWNRLSRMSRRSRN